MRVTLNAAPLRPPPKPSNNLASAAAHINHATTQHTPRHPPYDPRATDPHRPSSHTFDARAIAQADRRRAKAVAEAQHRQRAPAERELELLRAHVLREARDASVHAVEAGARAAALLELDAADDRAARELELSEYREALAAAEAATRQKAEAEAEARRREEARAAAEAKARAEAEAKARAEAEGKAAAEAVAAAASAPAASAPSVAAASPAVALPTSAAHAAAAAGASAAQSSASGALHEEWREARAAVKAADAARPKNAEGGQQIRRIEMLVGQTSRILYVVYEKAEAIMHELTALRASYGEPSVLAGCHAMATKVLVQGMMVAERSRANAYPLALLALSVGARERALWPALRHAFISACPYIVPHYVARPVGASDADWMRALGYAERADGKGFETKEQYYNRMSGIVSLWSVILQAQRAPVLVGEAMELQPAQNGLYCVEAWRWMARQLNQPPQRITATILLALLKPSAYMLGMQYPRQFTKMLRYARDVYCARIDTVVAAASGPAGKGAEERAGAALLQSWLDDTLERLDSGKGLDAPGEDAVLPDFKTPDDTREAGEDW